ncbi:spore germination protein A2 [Polycladomyces abyssicola]|uniref:Spore germination protein A2 n=1 Tax=Polycladomyces abyssicola TaxID=1125966 RepID=A0A8D5ZPB6_9BACL|nr:endospore germination permease [Polycladomyces abyssicola]BCU82188.1 spore germination protein A2 [Polycladomyces abyssicola]
MNSSSKQMTQKSVSTYQAFALITSAMIGVGVLSMPQSVAKDAGPDGVWIFPMGGLLVALGTFFVTKLGLRFPDQHFVQYIPRILGSKRAPWLGKIMSAPLIVISVLLWLLTSALVSRLFGEGLVATVLQRTPLQIIIFTMIAVGAVVAAQRTEVIARFNEFLLPFLFVPFVLNFFAWLQRGELENLLPLFQVGPQQLLRGLLTSFFAFAGFELVLNYMPDYQQPQKAMIGHMTGIAVVTVLYWTTFMASLATFGPFELVRMTWPTYELIKVASIPGNILERLESAIITVWMVAVFTTLIINLNTAINTTMVAFRWPDRYRKWIALGCLPVLYVIAVWPPDMKTAFLIRDWIGIVLVGYAVLVSAFLLIIAVIRKIKGGTEDVASS